MTLRPWSEGDIDNLVSFGSNPKIACFMSDGFPHPFTLEKARLFIQNANEDYPVRRFAIDMDGEAIGSIGIHPQEDIHRRNAEMGYWLAESYWGQGIMTLAIREMIRYTFENFDIDRVFARPFHTNIASHHALEKAGFKLEARFENSIIKNNVILDELIYAVRK
jgi:[ribosomal protein S5]-alanine N-acetyltransferase